MRVEVWSPDGIEAMGQAPATTLHAAENGPAVCITDEGRLCRVWLEPDEIVWLAQELASLRLEVLVARRSGFRKAAASASATGEDAG